MDIIEKQMASKLEEIRLTYSHCGDKGGSVEVYFRKYLLEFLPRKYDIGTGEVIDSIGNHTGQIDMVITNEYHPRTYEKDSPGIFFIEGVSSAGEIKTTLLSKDINDIFDDAYNFKKMHINLDGVFCRTNESDSKRFIESRPYFLFAFESQLSLKNIISKLMEYKENKGIDYTKMIDGIFILNKGIILNLSDGKGAFKVSDASGKTQNSFWHTKSPIILSPFYFWLLSSMPRIILFEPYLQHYIQGTIDIGGSP